MNATYVQIGAGAGDQDGRANFRDGFTEYIKDLDPRSIHRLILVEPNPTNIPALRKCWKDYPQAEILQIGIRTADCTEKNLVFYFAADDAPHFHAFSLRESHVRKHYPHSPIQTVTLPTITVSELLHSIGTSIELLALDIEGIDAEIILEIDWASHPCKRVSFEFLHLGKSARAVYDRLRNAGYFCTGWGLDVNHYDLMYERPRSVLSWITAKMNCFLGGWWRLGEEPVRFKIVAVVSRLRRILG